MDTKTWQPPKKIWNIMFIGIFFANMAMTSVIIIMPANMIYIVW